MTAPSQSFTRTRSTAVPDIAPLLVILTLAFSVRLWWILAADLDITGGFHFDMSWYHAMGIRIAGGEGLTRMSGVPTAEWPPAYPAVLGLIYALVGPVVLVPQILNALLATATCALVYELGRRVDGARAGLVGASLLALSPGDIMFAPLLLAEVSFTAALVAACLLFVVAEERGRMTGRTAASVGIALGFATLFRGASIAFPGVLALASLGGGRPAGATARALGLMCLGLLLMLAPWAIRNQIRLGTPVLLSTSLGRTLAHAHSEHESGGRSLTELRHRMDFWKSYEHIPQPRREIEINRAFTRDALSWAAKNPGREVALVPVRLVNLYRRDHAAMEWGRVAVDAADGTRQIRPLLGFLPDVVLARLADFYFLVLVAAGMVGALILTRRRETRALLIPGAIAYFTLLHCIVFPGEPRYHYPVVPFLAIAAGVSLSRLARGDARP